MIRPYHIEPHYSRGNLPQSGMHEPARARLKTRVDREASRTRAWNDPGSTRLVGRGTPLVYMLAALTGCFEMPEKHEIGEGALPLEDPGASQATAVPSTRKVWALNPYDGVTADSWHKGETHVHSARHTHCSVLDLFCNADAPSPGQVLRAYKKLGFDFVGLTDHYFADDRRGVSCIETFTNPNVDRVTYLPSMEIGIEDSAHHLLTIGIPSSGRDCRPPSKAHPVFARDYVDWIEVHGGVAVAAHPSLQKYWSIDKLATPWLRGVEISDCGARDAWREALRVDLQRWAFSGDDTHRLTNNDGNSAIGWKYVVASSSDLSLASITSSLREGRTYAVRHLMPEAKTLCGIPVRMRHPIAPPPAPEIRSIRVDDNGMIAVEVSGATSARIYTAPTDRIGTDRDGDAIRIDSVESSTGDYWPWSNRGRPGVIHYQIQGSEGYVRFELENCPFSKQTDSVVAFSQPIFVGGSSTTRSVKIDWSILTVVPKGTVWMVSDNKGFDGLTFKTKEHAELAVSVMKENAIDSVQLLPATDATLEATSTRSFDPTVPFYYMSTNNEAPKGGVKSDETCREFSPTEVRVALVPGSGQSYRDWALVDATGEPLLRFGDMKVSAHRAKEVVDKFQFNRFCRIEEFYYFKQIDSDNVPSCDGKCGALVDAQGGSIDCGPCPDEIEKIPLYSVFQPDRWDRMDVLGQPELAAPWVSLGPTAMLPVNAPSEKVRPLYRCFVDGAGYAYDHLTTRSESCDGHVAGPEGILGYIFAQPEAGTVALRACFDQVHQDHFTTVSFCSATGFEDQGLLGYAYPYPGCGDTDLLTDNANCGACGHECGQNAMCSAGSCKCADGFGDCNGDSADGCEVDLQGTDVRNCGTCGRVCAEQWATCRLGFCEGHGASGPGPSGG